MAQPYLFGVRHLSPNCSRHLLNVLKQRQPKCILLEAPADMLPTLKLALNPEVQFPIALMAYTATYPVVSMLYPLAQYSPEYQVLLWANQNGAHIEGIDLPITHSLARTQSAMLGPLEVTSTYEGEDEDEGEAVHALKDAYEAVAQSFGESSYEDYWERYFEHEPDTTVFIEQFNTLIQQVRAYHQSAEYHPLDEQQELERESFMLHSIRRAMMQYHPEEILVVVGAYHVPVLEAALVSQDAWQPLGIQQLEKLPTVQVKQALMPYSFQRLSFQSGYGAGNRAPYYYQMLWESYELTSQPLDTLYVSKVFDNLRSTQANVSSAQAIEAVRLAQTLPLFKGKFSPVLTDLQDAIRCCVSDNHANVVQNAITLTNHSNQFGFVPHGMGQTPLQDDFYRQLAWLKLEKYKQLEPQILTLDIRENRRVSSADAAWRDFNRSVFLNRLNLIGIPFAVLAESSANIWTENWSLTWSPNAEIELVEASLNGETVEIVAHNRLQFWLDTAEEQGEGGITDVAKVIEQACLANLPSIFFVALNKLQSMAAESIGFAAAVTVMQSLSHLIQFGNLRRTDVSAFPALLSQLFVRSCLLAPSAARGDHNYAKEILGTYSHLETLAQAHSDILPLPLWYEMLEKIISDSSAHPLISGFACAILLEHDLLSDSALAQELQSRLKFHTTLEVPSLGNLPIELSALWFEGFAKRNRYALLAKESVWRLLDEFIQSIPEAYFPYILVVLRRTFADFERPLIQKLSRLLADFWSQDEEKVGVALIKPLNLEEQAQLDTLNEFDFDF